MFISNDLLIDGEYGLSSRNENRALFVDSCVQFLKSLYFDVCKLLKANLFVYIYEKFEPNVHYCANTLKTVTKQRERKNNLVLQVSGMSCKQQL